MPTFMLSLNWTDQGIRAVKESPKRAQAGRELAKKVGVEIKQLFLTSGDCDIVLIVDAPDGDNVAKFALLLGSLGSVRTRMTRTLARSGISKAYLRTALALVRNQPLDLTGWWGGSYSSIRREIRRIRY